MNLATLEESLLDDSKDLGQLSSDEQFQLLKNRAVTILKPSALRARLKRAREENKPLTVKYGIDPTSRDIHLGHIVPLIVASRLQRMGHHLIIVFGDFTALVGDPSGRIATRPILSEEEIAKNVATYSSQISRFIDVTKAEFVFNSFFYKDMSIRELITLYRQVRIQTLLQRDDFRSRIEGLTVAEAIYPTLMGIDSVKIQPDIEIGGKDQILNFQVAISMMEANGLEAESAITTDLLLGTSGDKSKMSKSRGNYIALSDEPKEVFGKIMSIPDSLLEHYLKLLTPINDSEWTALEKMMISGEISPMSTKRMLARIIVAMLHDRDKSKIADKQFSQQFSERQVPDEIPTITIQCPASLIDILVENGMIKSRSEVRRLVSQGGLYIVGKNSDQRVTDANDILDQQETVLRIGRRKYLKITRNQ